MDLASPTLESAASPPDAAALASSTKKTLSALCFLVENILLNLLRAKVFWGKVANL